MSLLSPLSIKKPILGVLVVAIALLLATSLSQTVESAGDRMRSSTQTKGKDLTKTQLEQRRQNPGASQTWTSEPQNPRPCRTLLRPTPAAFRSDYKSQNFSRSSPESPAHVLPRRTGQVVAADRSS